MKSIDYIVEDRSVCQRPPEVFRRDAREEDVKRVSILMENSRISWDDITMVYQMRELRRVLDKKARYIEVAGLYLQGKPGKTDFKYMNGLSVLVPIPNVYKEVVDFMKGGWSV